MDRQSEIDDRIEPWVPSRVEVERLCVEGAIPEGAEIKPCGCGVKLDLGEVVYPVLEELGALQGFGARCDAARVDARLAFSSRIVAPAGQADPLGGRAAELPRSGALAGLVSLTPQFYEDPEGARRRFKAIAEGTRGLLARAAAGGREILFGKAHSIEAGGDFLLFDVFAATPERGLRTHLNNDTIITADSMLRTDSRISVVTAIHNALNDLFVCGAIDEIEVFPVVDGADESCRSILADMEALAEGLRRRGVKLTLHALDPVGMKTDLVGATVIGTTRNDSSTFRSLRPGDEILVTRRLGDLSILALHRSLVLEGRPVPPKVRDLRVEVLRRFMTSQYPLGRLVRNYMPELGGTWDSARHLSFVTDLSGPGLSALDEAARLSGVDVMIERLEFIDAALLGHYRRNHTSSTNGPLLITGGSEVMRGIARDLQAMGLSEAWRLGKVVGRSAEPTIWLDPALRAFQNEEDPSLDLFSPEVEFAGGKRRIPIFKRMRFGRP